MKHLFKTPRMNFLLASQKYLNYIKCIYSVIWVVSYCISTLCTNLGQLTNLFTVDVMSIVEGPGLDRMWKAITSPWTVADTARRSKVKRIIHWDKDRHFPLHSPIQKQKTKNIQKPIPIKIYLKTFPTQYARLQNCHDNTILNTLSGICLF